MYDTRRRRVLRFGGATVLSGLAGCSAFVGNVADEGDIQDTDGDERTEAPTSTGYQQNASFEDGTIEPFVELNNSGWAATSAISQNDGYSIGVDNQSPPNDDPDLRWNLSGEIRLTQVIFHFYEYEDQQSGSLYLMDENDNIITGSGTSNPEWTVRDSPTEGGRTWYRRSEDSNYQRWIRMSLQLNWDENIVFVTGRDLQTNASSSTQEQLLSTNPVSSIVIGSIRFRDDDYRGNNPKHMYFDNITISNHLNTCDPTT